MGENRVSAIRSNVLLIEGGINDTYASSVGMLQYANWTENDLKSALPVYCYMLDYSEIVSVRYENYLYD